MMISRLSTPYIATYHCQRDAELLVLGTRMFESLSLAAGSGTSCLPARASHKATTHLEMPSLLIVEAQG